MHCTDKAIATDVTRSVVCVFVCLCVYVLDTWVSCAKTAEPINMLFRGLTCTCPRNHVLHGIDIPYRNGKLVKFSPIKTTGSLCYSICSKRDNSIINNSIQQKDHSILSDGMTTTLLQLTAMLPITQCHITSHYNVPSKTTCDVAFPQNSVTTVYLTDLLFLEPTPDYT